MADFDNCCVNDKRYIPTNYLFRQQPPLWPDSRLVTVEEAFHFAACCHQIAKAAKASSKLEQTERSTHPAIVQIWLSLSCCDGLTGATLGVAVKRGFDNTVCWLCSALTYGGQVIAEAVHKRVSGKSLGNAHVIIEDYDNRPERYELQELEASLVFPKPIPEVLQTIVSYLDLGDDTVASRE